MMTYKQSSSVADIERGLCVVTGLSACSSGTHVTHWDEVHADIKDGYLAQISFWTTDRKHNKCYTLNTEDTITIEAIWGDIF